MALKYARVPVVSAPHGMALGGGCEVCLHSDQVNALAETYMGLVEIGVGLLPAGGGTKELALRAVRAAEAGDADPSPFVFKAFSTIAMGKVSTSAAEAAAARLPAAGRRDHPERRPADPRRQAEGSRTGGELPAVGSGPGHPGARTLHGGQPGVPALEHAHGRLRHRVRGEAGRTIADVLTGGDVAAGTVVTEQWFLDLEREAFLKLCGEKKTVERIQHMLKKGKPLRN